MTPIYLDHNSTTAVLPEVADAMLEVYRAGFANPASQHQLGQRARRWLEETREATLALLGGRTSGMDADRLVFTSGGTEANHLALRGLGHDLPGPLLVSAIEHPSLLGPAEELALEGEPVQVLPVDQQGTVDLSQVEAALRTVPRPRLISVMAANNETGALQPVEEIAALARRYGVLFHCDATQTFGKCDPASFAAIGCDAMTVSPHKFHGPVGIGGLVLRGHTPLHPLMIGGFQQGGLRPGTESLALAAGFRKALEAWFAEKSERQARLLHMRDRFEALLVDALGDTVVVNAGQSARLPNTSNIAFLGLDRQELLLSLDMAGVCCATGSACASGSSEPSPVLLAMGLSEGVVRGSLRFSFGGLNKLDDAEEASRRIINQVKDLRSKKRRDISPRTPPQPASKPLE